LVLFLVHRNYYIISMGKAKLYLTLFFMSVAAVSFAKGHGGGHGGHHSGGHHSGGGHSGGGNRTAGTGARTSSAGGSGQRSGNRTTVGGGIVTRVNGPRGGNGINNYQLSGPRTTGAGGYYNGYRSYYYGDHWSTYPRNYYGYDPFYNPYFYNPYFSSWSLGMGYMYAPSYNYGTPNNNYNPGGEEPLDGYVVFEHDTISGDIIIKQNAILLSAADSTKGYDYVFKIKKPGLTCVTAFNDDNKALNLVRLKDNPKKLWRIVHEGVLMIYDGRHDFIYRPEDVDLRTLMVVYNTQEQSINSPSPGKTKDWLTGLVNQIYGQKLNPKDFTWSELLIYIDKLD